MRDVDNDDWERERLNASSGSRWHGGVPCVLGHTGPTAAVTARVPRMSIVLANSEQVHLVPQRTLCYVIPSIV